MLTSRVRLLIGGIIAAMFLLAQKGYAYPDFIGYGYAACLTCHYNGAGGGALNDYGRALWSAEIASRALYPSSMDDEELGNQSGFLGKVPLPYWLRPDIKYRGIDVQPNPGSGAKTGAKFYTMQEDYGLVLQDAKQKYVGVLTIGRIVPPEQFEEGRGGLTEHLFAREYYVRTEVVKSWWVYAGLMEKIFGIRNIDHTSYQRIYQGFNVTTNDPENDIAESEGIVVHKVEENWELAINAFFGNPYDSPSYKQTGASMMGEIAVGENRRLGASLFYGNSTVLNKQMAAVHYRHQLSKASSLMFETGLIQDQLQNQGKKTGSYDFIQTSVNLLRGYNLLTTVERYNQEFKSTSPDAWRWGFGFLIFPAPRFEFRLQAFEEREISPQQTAQETWSLLGQVHVSL